MLAKSAVLVSAFFFICVALASAIGDSYTDTGFNIILEKPSASNPIGNPAFPGYTTSGGNNWLTYLSKTPSPALLSYNFANGGAITSDKILGPFEPVVPSFVDQISTFTTNLAPRPSYARWTSADSLFGVWIGINDVGNGWHLVNWTTLAEAITSTYLAQVSILYSSGARNFVFLTVPPIELTPYNIAETTESQKAIAESVVRYNTLLTAALKTFAENKTDVTTWIVDTAPVFHAAIADPTAHGAPNATCWNEDGVNCLWYNEYHPGQAIQKLVGEAVALEVGI
ncbi:GDSL-like Lipase/Acylhydrolase [Diplocarpon rosae]|nr:GDSL-like Lipase/Acylhydrolase [Diplocarpon rosae]